MLRYAAGRDASAAPGGLAFAEDGSLPALPRPDLSFCGSFAHGLRSGRGGLTGVQPNGEGFSFAGRWRAGLAHGRGALENTGGSRYEGPFRDGLPHGQGRLQLRGGAQYAGGFVRGEREGRGAFYGADGSQFTGGWRGSLRHGKGVQIFPDGSVYAGHFRCGRFDGRGRLTLRGESLESAGGMKEYEGNFRDGRMEGYGVAVFAGRERYEGSWRAGRMHGRGGRYYFPHPTDGSEVVFRCDWQEGRREGLSTFTAKDGKITSIRWREDRIVGVSSSSEGAPLVGDG